MKAITAVVTLVAVACGLAGCGGGPRPGTAAVAPRSTSHLIGAETVTASATVAPGQVDPCRLLDRAQVQRVIGPVTVGAPTVRQSPDGARMGAVTGDVATGLRVLGNCQMKARVGQGAVGSIYYGYRTAAAASNAYTSFMARQRTARTSRPLRTPSMMLAEVLGGAWTCVGRAQRGRSMVALTVVVPQGGGSCRRAASAMLRQAVARLPRRR